MPRPTSPWTDELVEVVTAEWKGGKSAHDIATRYRLTKSAVIAKMHRMQIPHPATVLKAALPKLPKRQKRHNRNTRRVHRVANVLVFSKPRIPRQMRPPSFRERSAPHLDLVRKRGVNPFVCDNVKFLDRARGQCAWPVDGEGVSLVCCGHATGDHTLSYCPVHVAVSALGSGVAEITAEAA